MGLTALTAVFVVDRTWVLASSGHLFTDINPAEYGFLSVVSDFLGRPAIEQLADPVARADLLHAFRLVGNQMHGTLGALGVAMLMWVQATGAILGTGLLRGFALAQSTLTVVFWMIGLWRATGSARVLGVFMAAAVFGPPVWLGLNLLCWGTHETVGLVQAALVCVALPWMAHPRTDLEQGVRTIAMGVSTGLATLLNPALALPGVSATLGVGLARWFRQPSVRTLWTGLVALMMAAIAGLLILQGVLSTGFLDGLGYPRGLPLDRLTGLIGKNGGPLLHARAKDASELALWMQEAKSQAFVQAPTAAYGVVAAQAEGAARCAILGTGALAISLLWSRGDAGDRAAHRAAAWLGIHLLGGLVATLWLTRHTSLDPTVPTGAPPRYFAHLYPFGFAVLAMVVGSHGATLRRWAGVVATAWVLWVGAFEHRRCVDTARLDPTELAVGLHYDGAAAWFTDRPRSRPSPDLRPFPDQSDDFRAGYAVISGLSSSRYWVWIRPGEVARSPDLVANAFVRSLRPSAELAEPRAYWLGVGAALRLAVPKSRLPHAAAFWKQQGPWSDVIREGYDNPPRR